MINGSGRPRPNDLYSGVGIMKKTIMLLALLGLFAAVQVGCEAKADVDDDGASIKVDD
jgi:hypothetical protein